MITNTTYKGYLIYKSGNTLKANKENTVISGTWNNLKQTIDKLIG